MSVTVLANIPANYVLWMGTLSALFVVLSLLLAALVTAVLPRHYFLEGYRSRWTAHWHPALRWPLRVIKNLVGLALVLFGILLSLPAVPGQGLLTVFLGLLLLDFPGKRGLERRLIAQPRILRAVNGLRRRLGRPPLLLPATPAPTLKKQLVDDTPQG